MGEQNNVVKKIFYFFLKGNLALPALAAILFFIPLILILLLIIIFFAADEQNNMHQPDSGECNRRSLTIKGEINNKKIVLEASSEDGMSIKNIKGTSNTLGFTAEKKSNDTESGKEVVDTTTCEGIIWKTLRQGGFSEAAAAGLMGNLQGESGYDPNMHEVGGPGRGLMQWTYGSDRWYALNRYAAKKGTKWNDCQTQAEFLAKEVRTETTFIHYLKNREGGKTVKDWLSLSDLTTATEWVCRYYIRPLGNLDEPYPGANHPTLHWDRRLSEAKKAYKKFTGKAFGESAYLTGTYKDGKVSITGDINGEPVEATGEIKDNKFEATGTIGSDEGCEDSIGSISGDKVLPWGKAPWKIAGVSANYGNDKFHSHYHNGADWSCHGDQTLPFYSILDGKVIEKGFNSARGYYVAINHGKSSNGKELWSITQHMSTLSGDYKVGSKIQAGTVLGKCGNTGNSFGAHLHYELHYVSPGGRYVYGGPGVTTSFDPVPYLQKMFG